MRQHYLSLNTIKFKRNLTMSKSIYTPSEQFCNEHYYPISHESAPTNAILSGWGVGGYISDEYYKIQSEQRIGKGNPFYGKSHTTKSKNKMRNHGYKNHKAVLLNGITYKSCKEAATANNVSKSCISKYINNGKAKLV